MKLLKGGKSPRWGPRELLEILDQYDAEAAKQLADMEEVRARIERDQKWRDECRRDLEELLARRGSSGKQTTPGATRGPLTSLRRS